MNVTIRKNNIRVQDRTIEYAEEKLSKLTRYMPNITSIHLDLSRQNRRKGGDLVVAQITVRHERGAIIRAEERDVYDDEKSVLITLNRAIDTMQTRINRFKGKRRSKRERMYEKYRMTVEEIGMAEDIPEEAFNDVPEVDVEFTEEEFEVVRRKVIEMPPMTEAEAIEQMELLGHDFFMFLNVETRQINVTYKRDEGGYGSLIPESQ